MIYTMWWIFCLDIDFDIVISLYHLQVIYDKPNYLVTNEDTGRDTIVLSSTFYLLHKG